MNVTERQRILSLINTMLMEMRPSELRQHLSYTLRSVANNMESQNVDQKLDQMPEHLPPILSAESEYRQDVLDAMSISKPKRLRNRKSLSRTETMPSLRLQMQPEKGKVLND